MSRLRLLTLFAVALVLACATGEGPAPEGPRPAWEDPPPPPREAPVVAPDRLQRAELDNGARVLLLEDHRLPWVTVGVTLRRGEAGVPVEQAGLAPFTAELMRRGAGDRDALALAAAVEEMGARLSVSAGWDEMSVRVSGLSRDQDRLLEILADVVLRPRFDPGEAEKARSETLAALERARDDPRTLASWNLARTLYPGHRLGLPRSGTPESVAGLDADDARALYGRLFVPGNAVFSSVGDIDPDALLARIGALFGSWTGDDPPAPGAPGPKLTPPARRIVLVDRPDLGQATLMLAHEGVSRTDPDRIPLSLLNAAVGGSGFSSRLMERLRSEEGLTYGVYAAFTLRRNPGLFFVSTSTRVAVVRQAVEGILEVLEGARSDPPAADELRDAQMLSVGRFSLGLETSAAVMESLVDLDVYGLPDDSLDTFRDRVRAVTPAEVAALARSHLHPERLAIVAVGPADELEAQLAGLGPIERLEP